MSALADPGQARVLLSFLDYLSYSNYLTGKKTPLDSSTNSPDDINTLGHVRAEGYTPTARYLLGRVNGASPAEKQRIAREFSLTPDTAGNFDFRSLSQNILKNRQGWAELTGRIGRLNLLPRTKVALLDLLRVLDYLRTEQAFQKNELIPAAVRDSVARQGLTPTLRNLLASFSPADQKTLGEMYGGLPPLTIATLPQFMKNALPLPDESSDLRAALCVIDPAGEGCQPPVATPPSPPAAPAPLSGRSIDLGEPARTVVRTATARHEPGTPTAGGNDNVALGLFIARAENRNAIISILNRRYGADSRPATITFKYKVTIDPRGGKPSEKIIVTVYSVSDGFGAEYQEAFSRQLKNLLRGWDLTQARIYDNLTLILPIGCHPYKWGQSHPDTP